MKIRTETGADHEDVPSLHERAFADPRLPVLVSALRTAPAVLPPISLVAPVYGQVAGHVLLSRQPSRPDSTRQDGWWTFTCFPRSACCRNSAERAAEPRSPAYYGRRGFTGAVALGFRSPSLRIPEPAFHVAVLPGHEPWMTGTLGYPAPFWDLDCVGLRWPVP